MIMDPSRRGFSSSVNGIQLGNRPFSILSDHNLVAGAKFENSLFDRSFREVRYLKPDPASANTASDGLSVSPEEDDCDFSDEVLKYINQMLMEEDMEDQTYMLQQSLDLQAAEKSFYEVLGKKYPPSGNLADNCWIQSPSDCNTSQVQASPFSSSNMRKNPQREDIGLEEERSTKQAAVYTESTLRSEMFDMVLLCNRNNCKPHSSTPHEALQNETSSNLQQQNGQEVVDLRTLLIQCAQAVAADDRRSANELLKQVRQHSSPFGDGNQRLAHCFADGLEARLAGTGSQIYKGLISKGRSAADILKAYHLYKATRLHIIDFGILYGFQWPTFIQRLSSRPGGPPKLPKKWETIQLEELQIDRDELLVVNCFERLCSTSLPSLICLRLLYSLVKAGRELRGQKHTSSGNSET
ncbi:unnamed protein product, partial [Vitis vinifera]